MKKHLLLLTLTVLFMQAYGQTDKWNGESTAWTHGKGTQQDPYLIESAANLAYLSQQVTNGNSYGNTYFRLTVDLDLNNIEWTPIGGRSPQGGDNNMFGFGGIFDGNDKTVSNLKIVAPDKKYTALFGSVSDALHPNIAEVHNLHIGSGSIDGLSHTSALAGFLNGTIKNCTNAAQVHAATEGAGIVGSGSENSQIINCSNSGIVTGKDVAGILTALSECLVRNCTNTGKISGDDYAAGIGVNIRNANMTDCRNKGEITGNRGTGILNNNSTGTPSQTNLTRCSNTGKINGEMNATGIFLSGNENKAMISDCYNTGEIVAQGKYTAGIAGGEFECQISSCYNAGNISESTIFGPILATLSQESTLTNCYYLDSSVKTPDPAATSKSDEEMKSQSLVSLLNKDHDFPCWKADKGSNDGYPVLIVIPYSKTFEATNITATGATLKAIIEAGSEPVLSSGFIYQASTDVKKVEIEVEIIDGTITAEITCKPGTQYNFSVFLKNQSGVYLGESHTFSTPTDSGIEGNTEKLKSYAYPNPVRGLLNIPIQQLDGETNTLRIYNGTGQCITEIIPASSSSEITVDTSDYAAGTYIYRYGNLNGKFIVN